MSEVTRLEDLTKGALVRRVLGNRVLRLANRELLYRRAEAGPATSRKADEQKCYPITPRAPLPETASI